MRRKAVAFLKDSKWRDIAPLKGDKVERRRVVIKGGDPAGCGLLFCPRLTPNCINVTGW